MPALPRDLFMIMRVITLLRGVMASLGVRDVSSALIWRPLALQVIFMGLRAYADCQIVAWEDCFLLPVLYHQIEFDKFGMLICLLGPVRQPQPPRSCIRQ